MNAPGAPAAPTGETLLAQIDALTKHDVLARLGEITCPTLVLGGKMDMMVPGFASEEIAAAIPGAELTMFETGHGCMVEEMTGFNERVGRFLADLV
jgi:pimeloyl-ACP methyl ester carboxylesterase